MSLRITILNLLKKLYLEKDFSFLILNLSLFLLPLSINLSTIGLVSAMLIKIIQVFFLKHKLYSKKSLKFSSFIGVIFFVYIIMSAIVQTNLQYTFKIFDEEFSHLVLLFLVPMMLRGSEDNKLLSLSLLTGLVVACIYVFVMSFLLKITFNKIAFLELLKLHHTYLSIYTLFFVNILLSSISSNKKLRFTTQNIIFSATIIVAFLLLFILGSKVAMVVYFIFIAFYAFKLFSGKKQCYFLVLFIPILVSCFFIFNQKIDTTYTSALNFRAEIWEQSLNSIKDNPFFGNLKMNEKDILNFYHYKNGKYYLMDSDLNSHNQFLSFLIKYGFVGFIILLFFVFNLFRMKNVRVSKVKINQVIGFFIIMFFTFYIENVFDRHHGIVFFTIFFNYYLVKISDEKA